MIGFPHYGEVKTQFMLSVVGLVYYDARNRDILKTCEGYQGLYVAQNRNEIVKSFLSRPLEYLLFLDSDIEFKKDTLYTLLDIAKENNKLILTGLYFGYTGEQKRNLVPLWYESVGDNEFKGVSHIPVDSLVKLSGCGMGFCLIHRSVFEAFPETEEPDLWFGHDLANINGKTKRLGEDFSFCKRVRNLGFEIWGYSGVMVNHYKTRPENISTFVQSQR